MRFVAPLVLVITIIACSFFSYQVLTFSPDDGLPDASSNPSLAYINSVKTAKVFWESNNIPIPCKDIDLIIVEQVPGLAERKDAAARVGICEIIVRRAWYQQAASPAICAVTLHEVGHIGSLRHSPNPENIMFHDIRFIPKECEDINGNT